jgi:acyl carrier protein
MGYNDIPFDKNTVSYRGCCNEETTVTKTEFLEELEIILNEDEGSLKAETLIEDVEGWDSTGLLGVIGFLDFDLEVQINVDTLRNCKTIAEVLTLVSDKLD